MITLAKRSQSPQEWLSKNNPPVMATYATLIAFTIFVSPGSYNSDSDMQLIKDCISSPTAPGSNINHLWFIIWNFFPVASILLASLILPGDEKKQATPFLFGSVFAGYFALGPHLMFREPSSDIVKQSEIGWVTRNIFENKVFAALLLLFSCSTIVNSSIGIDVVGGSFPTILSDYITQASTSKIISTGSADLFCLLATCNLLIKEDAVRRNGGGFEWLQFLPIFGPLIWLLVRPNLKS
ncbi:hypothetical protein ScalyP_jg3978 [Parmales sp. scaly parma]|nr:hypothetical protein ScalyP_jg3978 [Parmales sp. scaly parma]